MPTTRAQAASGKPPSATTTAAKPPSKRKPASKRQTKKDAEDKAEAGAKRKAGEIAEQEDGDGANENGEGGAPPEKRVKKDKGEDGKAEGEDEEKENKRDHPAQHTYQTGTIERGHIYFFYRPRVELEEVHAVDDVQRFHMLLVPRPPAFSASASSVPNASADANTDAEGEMNLVGEGADAVPAPPTAGETKKPFRLVSIGKKQLPDPDAGGGGGGRRKATFWATVAAVGDDLRTLQDGLGGKEYETKTRGTRHQGPARIAARGAYALVNSAGRTPFARETHLGYHLSHPAPDAFGDVQAALGLHQASSFVVQVKNPDAPNTAGQQVGGSKKAQYPDEIMREVFGKGGSRGQEAYGLRFASVERKELLDYEGAELLLIAARSGEEGLETSLGEGRGEALKEAEEHESNESIDQVLKELALDSEKIPAEPLEGEWL